MTEASPLERLLSVIEREELLYVELRDLLQEERGFMVTLDAEALGDAARRKEEIADQGRLVEETRIAVARELAATIGLDEPRPTLTQLCEALGPEAPALRAAHTRLLVLVSAVRELLDANAALAGESLTQVRGTLRLLGGLLPGDLVYERSGAGDARPGPGALMRRQV